MRWFLMILAAVAVFLWILPLRLVAPAQVPGLEADTVSGSVWDGHISGARYNGIDIGNLDVALSARSLLSGEPAINFRRLTPYLEGRASGNRLVQRVDGVKGELQLPLLPRPMPPVMVQLDGISAAITPAGCRNAGGTVTARLPNLPLIGQSPQLAGTMRCDGQAFLVPLRSERSILSIDLRLWRDGRWQADLDARPTSPLMAAGLQALGFVAGGGTGGEGFSFRMSGQA